MASSCSLRHHKAWYAGLTLDDMSVVMQLATASIVWPSTATTAVLRRLPWQFFSVLIGKILQLPWEAPAGHPEVHLPQPGTWKVSDLIPEAVCLMTVMTSSFLRSMRLSCHESGEGHFMKWILPILLTVLEEHSSKGWAGVVVILLAALFGQVQHDSREEALGILYPDIESLSLAGQRLSLMHASAKQYYRCLLAKGQI